MTTARDIGLNVVLVVVLARARISHVIRMIVGDVKGYLVGIHDLVLCSYSFYLRLTIVFLILSLLVFLFLFFGFNRVEFISVRKSQLCWLI